VHFAFVLQRNETAYRNMGEGWKRKIHDLLTIATEGRAKRYRLIGLPHANNGSPSGSTCSRPRRI